MIWRQECRLQFKRRVWESYSVLPSYFSHQRFSFHHLWAFPNFNLGKLQSLELSDEARVECTSPLFSTALFKSIITCRKSFSIIQSVLRLFLPQSEVSQIFLSDVIENIRKCITLFNNLKQRNIQELSGFVIIAEEWFFFFLVMNLPFQLHLHLLLAFVTTL